MPLPPDATLIVTAHNHRRYIDQTLTSVAAQDHEHLEVVIVDDMSTDGTRDAIEDWISRTSAPWKFIANDTNLGVCASLNRGLRASTSPLVAFLDGDDILLPHRISTHARIFSALPAQVGMVFSDALIVDDSGVTVGPSFLSMILGEGIDVPSGRIFQNLLNGNFLPTAATTVRRSALETVGYFDESLTVQDWDMWLRISRTYDTCFAPTLVAKYRLSEAGMSRSPDQRAPWRRTEGLLLSKWVGEDLSSTETTTLKRKLMGHARKELNARDPVQAKHTIDAASKLRPTPITKMYAFFIRSTTGAQLLIWSAVGRRRLYAALTEVLRRLRRLTVGK